MGPQGQEELIPSTAALTPSEMGAELGPRAPGLNSDLEPGVLPAGCGQVRLWPLQEP